jgi:cell migration-inducing and hyaluronan-binding protein
MALLWKGPGFRTQVVPTARLFPAPATKAAPPAKPWSDPATWGGAVPADGAAVTIPAGKSVLLDRDVSLANLTIDGTLQFARRDLTLEADWVLVHGALQVGTEASPFMQRAIIRLRDRTAGEDVMGVGDKVLGVMGGTLDLHGAPRAGWTRLGASAAKGSDRLTLATSPPWRVGDRIAIASTDFASTQDEEATITAISGREVTLDHALEFSHFGVLQTIAGRQLDERAEVALLSRNVTFEGESSSSANGFGAQIMVMDGGSARVEGAELQRVGQEGLLRRYPIHFHMLADGGANSYVRGSSIHHSNNRCATIHGTNQVAFTGNVCFDHAGHGIFLEDGAEHDNVIIGNLGMGTRAPKEGKRLLASDESPATYWLTNPDNVVRNNVAAGSEGNGFWIALPEHPTGLFAKTNPAQARAMWNRRTAITEFNGNVAHSNGGDGLHFDRGPRPDGTTETTHHHAHVDPADEESRTIITELRGFVSWKNRGEGAWLRGSEHKLIGATLADNAIGVTFASDESSLQDSFVVGESANVGTPASWEVKSGGTGRDGRSAPRPWDADYPVRGFEFYDGRVGVERTTFANFQPWTTAAGVRREQSAIGYHVDDDFSIHPRNYATAVSFVNARPVYLETPEVGHDGDVSAVFLDTDGSVTGTAGRSVMTMNPFLYGTGCEARADWNAQLCTGDYATLYVDGGTAASVRPVVITRPDGQTQTLRGSTGDDATDAGTTILANSVYGVAFNGGTPARARFVFAHGERRWARITIPHAERFTVTRWGCNVGQSGSWCFGAAASLAALNGLNRSGYWYDNGGDADPATGTLHLRFNTADSDYDELVVQ